MSGINCSVDADGMECMLVGSWTWKHKNALQAYVFYNNRILVFETVDRREQEYTLKLQRAFNAVGSPFVAPKAVERGDAVDKALRFLGFLRFSEQYSLLENRQL